MPFYNHSYAYNSWDRYVVGFSVAACVVGALFMPLVMRMFRYQISVGAAFVALFLGVIAANVVFGILVSASGNGSPYWSLPFSATFGPIGSLVSLLVSAWLVCELAGRRRRKVPEPGSLVGPS